MKNWLLIALLFSAELAIAADEAAEEINVTANNIAQIKAEIAKTYGVQAKCQRNILRLNGLSDKDCESGLLNLAQALAEIEADPNLGPHSEKLEISIVSSEKGWEAGHVAKPAVQIPSDADSAAIKEFLARQISRLFGPDENFDEKIAKAAGIFRDKYKLQVLRGDQISAREFLEGLVKIDHVISGAFGGQPPDASTIAKLGYDGIVIGTVYESLHEDNNRLLVKVNYRDGYGEIYDQLTTQVHSSRFGFASWSEKEIRSFRNARTEVAELTETLSKLLPDTRVNCVLKRNETDYLDIEKCEQGLQNLQEAARNLPKDVQVNFRQILVVDAPVRRNYLDNSGALAITYSAKPAEIIKIFKKRTK